MSQHSHRIDVDAIFRVVGKYGRYQLQIFIQILIGYFPWAYNVIGIVFLIQDIPFKCQPIEKRNASLEATAGNDSLVHYGSCSVEIYTNGTSGKVVNATLPCVNGYQYPEGKHVSLRSEWDLVCGNETLAEFIVTIYMIGRLVGCVIVPTLADRYGRKPIYVASHIGICITNIISTFSPSYTIYTVFKGLTGFWEAGLSVPGTIMLAELFPTESRTFTVVIGGIAWATSLTLLPLIAYLAEPYGWRCLNTIIGLLSCYSIIQYWTLDESLRWLLRTGKMDRARKIMKDMCRVNKVEYSQIEHLLVDSDGSKVMEDDTLINCNEKDIALLPAKEPTNNVAEKQTVENKDEKVSNIPGIFTIFMTPCLRKMVLVCIYLWFVCALVYYGLYMTLSSLSGNRFLNFFLTALFDLAANCMGLKIITRYSRKRCCIFFQTLTSFALISTVFFRIYAGDNAAMLMASTVLSLLGMYCIASEFLVIWVYTPELFPTDIRSLSLLQEPPPSLPSFQY